MKLFKKIFLVLFLVVFIPIFSQTKKQLKAKRVKLKKEIKHINKLLSKTKKDEKTLLTRLGDINKKIEIRQELIDVINAEATVFATEIKDNIKEIVQLEKQLSTLKKEYASMIVQSYKHKNKQNKLLYLVASDNFTQAYKRMQYLKQFAENRKEKANTILLKKEKLVLINDSLFQKKQVKEALVASKITERKHVDDEKNAQQKLLNKVQKQEDKYITQIRKKENEELEFENKLTNLIKGISPKKKGTKRKPLKLTPEAKKLASNFVANKGNMPHPVIKGYVSRYFGQRPHEELKKIKVKSNGWHYITEPNAKARSVFKGIVFAILVDKKTKLKTVLLQHGNYFTSYKNLINLYVSKGDKVTAKQNLGTIHTNKTTNKTKLVFSLWKNTIAQNPSRWMKK